MHFTRKLTLFTVTLLIILLFNFVCRNEVGAGSMAPKFSLPDLSGQMISLEEHRGSVVILDFWATWCPPCRMSIPELVKLQKKYGETGLVILGLSMDNPRQITDEKLQAFKEKNNINYIILRVNEKVIKDYFKTTSVSIPTMFVIDREGKIRDKLVGFKPNAVEKSLNEVIE